MKIFYKIKNYIKLMKVKHYIKNILIFFPLIFSKTLFDKHNLICTLRGFFIFSLACSIIYIINDITDKEKDKQHKTKKNRPIASGKVSIKEAIVLIFILFVFVIAGLIYFKFPVLSICLLLMYLILNISYSIYLKNVPLLDVTMLAFGFLIRTFFGASLINVAVSDWLYFTILSLSFYLVLGKRRNEVIRSNGNTRNVLKYYSKEFLDKNMYMCLSLAIVFYSLWVINISKNDFLMVTIPFVIIMCMRYSMDIEGNSDGDPVEVIFSDKILLLFSIIFGALLMFLLYL